MSENKMSTGTRSLRGAPKGEKDWMGDVSVLKRQNRTTPHDLLCLPKMKMSFWGKPRSHVGKTTSPLNKEKTEESPPPATAPAIEEC
jgi:hypothetical protein